MVGTPEGLEPDRLICKLDHDPTLLVDGLGQRCVYIIAQHGCHYVFHIRKRPPARISRNRMRCGRGYSVPGTRVVRRRGVPGYSRRAVHIFVGIRTFTVLRVVSLDWSHRNSFASVIRSGAIALFSASVNTNCIIMRAG